MNNNSDVTILITAVDRPEIHRKVFEKYLEYTDTVNCNWIITVNTITNNLETTIENIQNIFKTQNIHIKTYNTGGSHKDWYESVKYCINMAYLSNPSLAYVWLEDDWLLSSDSKLKTDLQLLDHDNCYISLHNRDAVSFNPGIWSKIAFNELMYNSINNPEISIGKKHYDRYKQGIQQLNPERICCPHPESTNYIKSFKSVTSRFIDVGRDWQSNTIKTRTFRIH
jgi:hypothetical protein